MLNLKELALYTKELSIFCAAPNQNETIQNKLAKLFLRLDTSSNRHFALDTYKRYARENGKYFDIVVIDLKDGATLYKEIIELNPSQKTIILIDRDLSASMLEYVEAGNVSFVLKPINITAITETIYAISQELYNNKKLKRYAALHKKLKNDKKHIYNELEQKSLDIESKNSFFAAMSHEIRTPMNAIIGLSNILLDEGNLSIRQGDYLSKINNSSMMLLGIINDILDFSKLEAGKLQLENIEFDINKVLDYVADMVSVHAQEKNIELVYEIDKNVHSHFIGDPLRISQIILNLMSNAVKFTHEGSVTLKVHKTSENENKIQLQFEIIDTGIGLTKPQIENLFTNYSQADSSTSREYGGTGLGLTISKQLTKAMDGTIWVESELEKGSRFFVNISLEKSNSTDKRAYHLPYKELMRKKVLIINSQIKSSKALGSMLDYFHMPVQYGDSVKEARKLIQSNKFDIIFIDELMYELCGLKDQPNNKISNLVLLEDRVCTSTDRYVQNSSINSYLKKPFNQQMLFNSIVDIYGDNSLKTVDEEITKEDIFSLGKKRILLAEDNIINQNVIQGILNNTELDLICVEDGGLALKAIEEEEAFDLIFMDINMPLLNGYQTVKIIRNNSEMDNIPIVAMTADVYPEDIQRAKKGGMQEHLAKPVVVQELYSILIKYLSD